MVGVITSWDILAHPLVTIECFGWRVFFKAISPWQGQAFLAIVQAAAFPGTRTAASNAPRILERCISLELQAKLIYRALAKALDDQGLVGPFFTALAEQEQEHADLLEICRAAALRSGWNVNVFNPWLDYLPRLEQQMDAAEDAVREVDSVDAALRLVVRIELSEINEVFRAAAAATDAAFVNKLRPFRTAMESHMAYIMERLPELSPRLTQESRELRARFPKVST